MHEYLVDDDLEDQRRRQCEQLDHEGRHQDFVEDAAVFADGPPEPSEIEAAPGIIKRRALGDEDEPPSPIGQEFFVGEHPRLGVAVALHEDAILRHLADNDEHARAQRCERRQRHLGEASHRGIDPFGLDREFSRGDQ